MKNYWKKLITALSLGCFLLILAACASEPVEVEIVKEVTVEVPVEVEKEVEVIKEVTVEVVKEVEVIKEVPAEVSEDAAEMEMAPKTLQTQLQFVTHVTAGMPEQDVFIVKDGLGDDEVVRATLDELTNETILKQTVYGSAGYVEHDPFGVTAAPLGPFPKGESLGFTMEEWLAASGSGTYTIDGGDASLDISFEGLLPNGVYTLWCTRITLPPEPVIFDIACGEWDGSNNQFVADAAGNGSLTFDMRPLPDITAERISLFALAYHSDGQTYGPLPGEFGERTHVQALAFIPAPGDEAWEVTSQ